MTHYLRKSHITNNIWPANRTKILLFSHTTRILKLPDTHIQNTSWRATLPAILQHHINMAFYEVLHSLLLNQLIQLPYCKEYLPTFLTDFPLFNSRFILASMNLSVHQMSLNLCPAKHSSYVRYRSCISRSHSPYPFTGFTTYTFFMYNKDNAQPLCFAKISKMYCVSTEQHNKNLKTFLLNYNKQPTALMLIHIN